MEKISTYTSAKDQMLSAVVPKQTRTYKPVSHQELIDLTLESIYQSGFELSDQSYISGREGQVATGKYSISSVQDNEMQLQIAWQNSYDKTTTLKFAIGTKVFVCENGMVSGDHGHFKSKHVGDIQTFAPQAITEYIKQSGDVFKTMQADRELMKSHEISDRKKAELLGVMFAHEGFILPNQAAKLQRELVKPTHDYGSKNNLWEMYNHTTFVIKDIHPRLWMKNHIACHDFFRREMGIYTEGVDSNVNQPLDPRRQLELFEELNA